VTAWKVASSDDERAAAGAALRLVRAARALEGAYAGPAAPLRTDQVSRLLGAAGCHVEVFAFQSSTVAMTLPRCAGVYPSSSTAPPSARTASSPCATSWATCWRRHRGAVFLADEGYMAAPERAADLFALADLVPGWWIAELRRGRTPWRTVRAEIAAAVAEYAEGWPPERCADRARLRLRLFRDHDI
jgi:hypothetical protein